VLTLDDRVLDAVLIVELALLEVLIETAEGMVLDG
jgi:hypothetical protein